MSNPGPIAIDLNTQFSKLGFLADRTPTNSGIAQSASGDAPWGAAIAPYRDGEIYFVHYAGTSEWERHPQGDEMVMVVEGSTTMFFLIDDVEVPASLTSGQMIVVPQGVWHRFETPDGAKIMAITPQPTDHSIDRPN